MPVTAPDKVPALVTVPAKPAETDTPAPTLMVGACSVVNLAVGAKAVDLMAMVLAVVSGRKADAVEVAMLNGKVLTTDVPDA